MPLHDLIYIKKLGEGQFGHVYLVKGRETKEYYALKAMSKQQIIAESLEKHTLVGICLKAAREERATAGQLSVHHEDVQNIQRR